MRCGESVYSYIGNGEVIFVLLLMRVGGFLTVCSGEVVSVWLLLLSDVWGVSNSVGSGVMPCVALASVGRVVGGCHW